MIARMVRTAVLAGAVAGLFAWGLQMTKTVPLILKAEVFEEMADKAAAEKAKAAPVAKEAATHSHAPGTTAHSHSHAHSDGAWEPANGFERNAYTLLFSVLAGVGFAFVLTGGMMLAGRPIGWKAGMVWGLSGFAAFYLAPAFGLAPELPGSAAAPLEMRQMWWIATAAATAAGLGLIFFAKGVAWKAVAAALIVLPHIIGAPHHTPEAGLVPTALAAEFAVASLVTVGLFWLALGGLVGYFHERGQTA